MYATNTAPGQWSVKHRAFGRTTVYTVNATDGFNAVEQVLDLLGEAA